jgi:5-methylcytosine-specific restriction endonuclease McrA
MNKKRQAIFDKSGGKCWYCGCDLTKGWHADHLEPVFRYNGSMQYPEKDNEINLVPACRPCNLFKATYSLEGFRREIEEQASRAMKQSVNYRTALRFNQIVETKKPVIFWFERRA